MDDHPWQDCRPMLFEVSRGAHARPPRPATEQFALVTRTAWESLPDSDRQAFHRFCCLGSRDPDDIAAMCRIAEVVSLELGLLD